MQYGCLIPTIYPTGVFIQSIEQTQISTEAGGKNIITVTLTNHTQQRFEILNGAKGDPGDAASIKEITASIDNGVGVPSVSVSSTGTGAEKSVHFDFKNLKSETCNVALTEELKQYISQAVASANQYTDGAIEEANQRIDTGDTNTLQAAKTYTDQQVQAEAQARVQGDASMLADAKQYTDTRLSEIKMPLNPVCCYDFADAAENIVAGFKIETLQNTVIDASGNGKHSTINGAAAKYKDDSIGTALLFEQGFLSRKVLDFIGVGKQWSHSRWIKINPNEQDKTKNFRLWAYNTYDYLVLDCKTNGGRFKNFTFMTYKDEANLLSVAIPAERVLNNEWHHLVVMTDLQLSYCKKIAYLDNIKIVEAIIYKDFSNFTPPSWASDGFHYDMTQIRDSNAAITGSLANLIFFDRLLTETERQWLYLNPYYPAKRYSLAEYKADENRKLLEELKKRIPTQ